MNSEKGTVREEIQEEMEREDIMANPENREIRLLLQLCYLQAELGLSYSEIAKFMNMSVPSVARKLANARERRLLETTINYPPQFEGDEMKRKYIVSHPHLESSLLERFKQIDNVIIVPSASTIDRSIDHVACAAADLIEQNLQEVTRGSKSKNPDTIIALNWGAQVSRLVENILPLSPERKHKVTLVPLLGDLGIPFRQSERRFDCSRIVNTAAEKLSTEPAIHLSVPSLIPIQFPDAEAKAIKAFMEGQASYQALFNEKDGIISKKVHTIITSLGDLQSAKRWLNLIHDDPRIEELEKHGVLGDIAQHLVTESKTAPADDPGWEFISQLNDRVVGVRVEHLKALVERFRRDKNHKGLGLTVLNVGRNRAKIVLKCLEMTGINHLVIDEDCAREMEMLDTSK
jgi:DNA-binding transcriptional regulator LsrR (DeoR family)